MYRCVPHALQAAPRIMMRLFDIRKEYNHPSPSWHRRPGGLRSDNMFCPKCKALMAPSDGDWLCRKCGYSGKSSGKGATKVKTDMADKEEMMVIEGDLETLPKTKAECPKCKHNEAYFVIRQTRAADEPETRIYRCAKCGASWREY